MGEVMSKFKIISALYLLFISTTTAADHQVIKVHSLSSAPVIDSQGEDWQAIPEHEIPLQSYTTTSKVDVESVQVKAGYHGGQVYFYIHWPDSEANLIHKPYVWNPDNQRYLRGPQREDRLALHFEMEGELTSDWREPKQFKADMWHWKASRSNPLGLVHDKFTIHSPNKLLRSSVVPGLSGHTQYVKRESDEGTKIYTTKRYRKEADPVMPKYILNAGVTGSVSDIKVNGKWREGRWHLEISRKMDTGYSDDVAFEPGTTVRGALAVFDSSESDDHSISKTLVFQFEK